VGVAGDLILFGFMAAAPTYAIGVDLGGTNLRAAAIDSGGKILGRYGGKTNLREGHQQVVDDIVHSIQLMREDFGGAALAGIGVVVPGFIRIEEGVIAGSNNLRQLEGLPIRDEISAELGHPVILENDANAAALGEKWMGAGREVDDLILLTLGTGIGGGIISKGRIVRGMDGMAGEFGHMTVVPNGNPCGCGNAGCLEKHASASAINAMAQLLQLGDDPTAKDVYEMALADGETAERARRVFESMGAALGIGLATLINAFNFPLYLLSGGPLPAWDLFAPAMMEEVRRRSFTFRNSKTRIEKAALGGDAGLYGAAYLPFLAARSLATASS
jgi:glucokinase